MEKEALRSGITQAFAVTCSHYDDNIDFKVMSLGFTPGCEPSELDAVEAMVTPFVETLVGRIEYMVLLERG